MRVALGAWEPDGADYGPGRLLTAENVWPATGGFYRPWPAFGQASPGFSLGAACVGSASFISADGYARVFAGTATALKMYTYIGDSLTDVSNSTTYTTVTSWSFCQFGAHIIAAGRQASLPLQYYTVGSSTDFADISGAPQNARFVATVGQFVVAANIGSDLTKVQWSAIGDMTDWTPDGTNQAGSETLADGGPIMGLFATDQGAIIFQAGAVRRMTYVGGDVVFVFSDLLRGVGVLSPGSLQQWGGMFFFLSVEGFCVMGEDGSLSRIGQGKIDKEFFDGRGVNTDFNTALVSSCIDAKRNLYALTCPDAAETNREIWFYNWTDGHWGYVNLGALASVLGFLCNTLEQSANSSPVEAPITSAAHVTSANTFFRWSDILEAGTAGLAVTLITTDFIGGENDLMFCRGVRPIVRGVDGQSDPVITVSLAARLTPGEDPSFAAGVANSAPGGLSPQRKVGRYMRVRLALAAAQNFRQIEAIDVDLSQAGRR